MSHIKDANPQTWLEKEAKSVGLIPLEGGGQSNGDFWIWCADVRFKENRSRFDYLKNKFSQTFLDYEIKGILPDREKPGEKVRRELLTKYNTESAPCYTIVVAKKSTKDSFEIRTVQKLLNSATAPIKDKYTICRPGRENGNTCTLDIKLKKEYRSSSEELAKKVVSSIKKSLPKFEDFKYKLTNEGFIVSFTDTNAYAKDSKVKDSSIDEIVNYLKTKWKATNVKVVADPRKETDGYGRILFEGKYIDDNWDAFEKDVDAHFKKYDLWIGGDITDKDLIFYNYYPEAKKTRDTKIKDSLLTDIKTQLEKLSEVEKVYDIKNRLNVQGKVGDKLKENIYSFNVKIKNDVPLTQDLYKKCKSVILYCCKSHGIIEGYSKECNAFLMNNDLGKNVHAFGFVLHHYLPINDSKTKDTPVGFPIEEKTSHIVYHDRERLDQLEKKLNGYFNISIVKGCELTASTIKLIREDYKADLKQVRSDPKLIEKESDVKNHYLKYQSIIDKVIQHYASANPYSDVWRQVSSRAGGSHKIVDAKVKDSFTADVNIFLEECRHDGLFKTIKCLRPIQNGNKKETKFICYVDNDDDFDEYGDYIAYKLNNIVSNSVSLQKNKTIKIKCQSTIIEGNKKKKLDYGIITRFLEKSYESNLPIEITCIESDLLIDSKLSDSLASDIYSDLKQQCGGLIKSIKLRSKNTDVYSETEFLCSLNTKVPHDKIKLYAERITSILNKYTNNKLVNAIEICNVTGSIFKNATNSLHLRVDDVLGIVNLCINLSDPTLKIVCDEVFIPKKSSDIDSLKDSIIQDIKSRPSVLDIKTKTQDSNDGNTTLTVRTYIRANVVDEIRWNEWSEDYLNRKSSSKRVVFCDSIPVDHNKTVKVNGEDCWVSDVKITYKK